VKYQTLPVWTKDTLPQSFQSQHNTKQGTWAKLTILEGELKYYALDKNGDIQSTHICSTENASPLVEPQAWHKVEPLKDNLRCFLEFYCLPEHYYQKKYHLSAPHPEVLEVLQYIQSGNALDLGSGRGRNSILLQTKGFSVTAVDKSEAAIGKLQEIIDAEEECKGIDAKIYDIQTASIKNHYDLIISTVVFQFLQPISVSSVIQNMQEQTKPGGYNLIVAPISTKDYPCPIEFPFTFTENGLKNYYHLWKICKYNEELGTFQRMDEQGNPLRAKFATLIAQK
ncbi:MAG: SAM-dependent methyltransferase TehB, partial [Cyanobacteria bacterium J06642_3]